MNHNVSNNKSTSNKRTVLSIRTGIILSSLLISALIVSGCTDKGTNEPSGAAASVPPVSKVNKEATTVKQAPTVKATKEQLEKWVAEHDGESLHAALSPSFQKKVSVNDIQQVLESIWPKEEKPAYVGKRHTPDEVYADTWTNKEKNIAIVAQFEKDRIIYMRLLPLEQFPDTDNYKTKTTFELPFDGEWFVAWGGHNVLDNYHYAHEQQRYALDLIVLKDGKSYKGDSSKNENYYAFGKKVLAPADGTVVDLVSDIPDNKPGDMNPTQPAGNYVIIDHGNKEYSILAHFKQNSIKVKKGDKVKVGDWLGDCGNSGNSSEAHIHYQVSDKLSLEHGRSLPPRFADGIFPEHGQTLKGQS